MEAYAVVETGGKQYMVRPGDVIRVEKLAAEADGKIELAPVLVVSSGGPTVIGAPEVSGAKVTATVVRQMRGEKVISFKKKRRKGYRKKIGHRQDLTELKVESVVAP